MFVQALYVCLTRNAPEIVKRGLAGQLLWERRKNQFYDSFFTLSCVVPCGFVPVLVAAFTRVGLAGITFRIEAPQARGLCVRS